MTPAWAIGFPTLAFGLLGIAGVLGLLAILSPAYFARIAQSGGHWIDTSGVAQLLDKPIKIDQAVLHYSRWFGIAVVVSSAWLAYLCTTGLR
jgi:hypothetical protein